MIQSSPDNAKLYLNGEPVGTTPYRHSDKRIVGSTNEVRLEKEGYETLITSFSRDEEVDVGAIIGGIFFLFPFLWTMKYKPTHTYEMKPVQSSSTQNQQ
ncbi:MAG: PEGA domain-containing protein [Cyclobacteriaceae bacterium]